MMYQVCSPFMSISKMKKIITLCALLALFAGCSKKELCIGDRVSKKVKQEKLEAVVLSIAEYDDYSNIIHKRTGSYKDTAGDSFSLEEKLKGKRAFKPVLSDLYDIYYEHEYDENGNLIHTFIHNTKDEDSLEYFFDYDDGGKIVHCKNGSGDEHWYEYDERGNMTHKKSYFYNDYSRLMKNDADKYVHTDFKHEYDEPFVETKIDNDAIFLFGQFSFVRYYSLMGTIRSLCVEVDDEEAQEILEIRDYEPRVDYLYGEKVNTEYYTKYQSQVYGYGRYFGSDSSPVGVDGKIYFDSHSGINRAARTFIEYYLRDDGTVEKSIEYTGFRKTAWFKKVRFRSSHGRGSYGRSLFPDHYEYD